MDYTVLARRFRPQAFGEVVGQEMIGQALRNAIAAERVAHAYLFTGARGVGKTSTARILAKSLNCPNAKYGNPCNTCEICEAISTGRDVDVIEIDGASNRQIDDIRNLRSNVNVKSMRSRYKIYIIDEVHMLTREAFNALLKTLEEPPPNVKFIFCTTDPQKLPDTILSRCQRFDFGTISTPLIKQRLSEIAATEGVDVEPAAVELVARRAAGSMRDSQSLFDQLLAFGGKSISVADVHRLLGTAPDERLVELVEALVNRRRDLALEALASALSGGVQLSEFTDQLVLYLRDLMVLGAGAAGAELVSVAEDHRETLARQAAAWGLNTILAALQIMSETKGRMKGVTYGRVLTELALVRMAMLDQLDQISELVAAFKQGGAAGAKPQSAPSRPAAPLPGRAQADGRMSTSAGAAAPAQSPGSGPAVSQKKSPVNEPEAPEENLAEVGESPIIPFEAGQESAILSQLIAMSSDMAKASLRNVLSAAISGPNQLVLTFPKSYDLGRKYFERSLEQVQRLEGFLEKIVGRPVRLGFAVDRTESPVETAAETRRPKPEAERSATYSGDDPLVQKALDVFGGTIVKVETARKE
jgi:DNA polymerase III subunit gamma/tau